MKVLVTGVSGQLGHDVMNELDKRGYTGIGSDIADNYSGIQDNSAVTTMEYVKMDITDEAVVDEVISSVSPDVIIHCAAWTADDDKVEKVRAVNAKGTANIAKAAKKLDCKMVYISTDYVFNGQGEKPWEPDCKEYKPLNVYGQTKLEGELAVADTLSKYFIVRIAWVFGANGNNFIKTMIKVGKNHETVRVVNDQIGTPTYTLDLAVLLVDMIATEKYGYYHATNEGGYISWYDFACEIYRQAGMDIKVIPVSTEEYGLSKAARPFNSRLDKSKLKEAGFTPLPTWQNAVERYIKYLKERKMINMKRISDIMWGLIFIIIGVILGGNALDIFNINLFFDGWWTLFIIVPTFIGLVTDNDKIGNLIGLIIGLIMDALKPQSTR